jgi:hypothetical protein
MSIFSQRTVQDAFGAIEPLLSDGDIKHLLNRLQNPRERIGAEWEVVCTATMMQIATVTHQVLAGSRRPDLRVVAPHVEFLADLCVVSDASAEDANPYDFFVAEMHRVARNLGLNGQGLYLHAEPSIRKGGARILALPSKNEVPRFIKQHLRPFLTRVAGNPKVNDEIVIEFDDVRVRLCFDAAASSSGGGHPVYTAPRSPDVNPLFGALKSKARQLRESESSLLKGAIVCDGGCDTLNCAADDVLTSFFDRHRHTVSFVVLVHVKSVPASFLEGSKLRPVARFYWNPHLSSDRQSQVAELIEQWMANMPHLTRDPSSASRYPLAAECRSSESFYGAVRFDERRARFSARTFIRLLAGDLRIETFLAHHETINAWFRYRLEHLEPLARLTLEQCPYEDDDWIVFSFNSPSPSAASCPTSSELEILHGLIAAKISHDEFAGLCPKLVTSIQTALTRASRLVALYVTEDGAISVIFRGHDAALDGFVPPRRVT